MASSQVESATGTNVRGILPSPAQRCASAGKTRKLLVPNMQLDEAVAGMQLGAVGQRNLLPDARDLHPECAMRMHAVLIDAVAAAQPRVEPQHRPGEPMVARACLLDGDPRIHCFF